MTSQMMTFGEHLRELGALLRPVAVAWFMTHLFAPWFIDANLMVAIVLSSAYALPFVYPFFAFQLFRFTLSGQYPRERKWVLLFLYIGLPAVIGAVAFALAYLEVVILLSARLATNTALPKALLTIGMGIWYFLESSVRRTHKMAFPLCHKAIWWTSMLFIVCAVCRVVSRYHPMRDCLWVGRGHPARAWASITESAFTALYLKRVRKLAAGMWRSCCLT